MTNPLSPTLSLKEADKGGAPGKPVIDPVLWNKQGGGMKKLILILILISLAFSLGIMADEAIRDNGWFWSKLSDPRRLGYVEGFREGHREGEIEQAEFHTMCKASHQAFGDCILSRLWGDSLTSLNQNEILDTMSKFYASPQNLPVRWGHAVIIASAMVSGVPVDEKDLQVIRKEDATPPKPLLEQETRDLLNGSSPKKQH